MSMGNKKGSAPVVTGYKYFLGAWIVFCQGPVNVVQRIRYGERQITWYGDQYMLQTWDRYMNSPELFGGLKQEGGIQGVALVHMGECKGGDYGYNLKWGDGYLSYAMQGGDYANGLSLEGLCGLVFKQCYFAANNPYLKQIDAVISNWHAPVFIPGEDNYPYWETPAWYPGLARVGPPGIERARWTGMNAAHIVRALIRSPVFGAGLDPATYIHEASFHNTAVTLANEGFGLSFDWVDDSSIKEFIENVVSHVNGVFYFDPEDQKFHFDLIRPLSSQQYDDMMVLDETNVISIKEYQRRSITDMVNQVTVQFTDGLAEFLDQERTVQNQALIDAMGYLSKKTIRYEGIDTAYAAQMVADRDLRMLSSPLAKITVKMSSEGALELRPGMAVKLSWDKYNIGSMVLRVTNFVLNDQKDGTIDIELLEDVWAYANEVYRKPKSDSLVDDGAFEDPIGEPQMPRMTRVIEAPFWELIRSE